MIAPLLALAMLTGCTDWPDPVIPGAAQSTNTAWPSLVPLGPLLAQADAAPTTVEGPPANRIAALNARAAALRGRAVIDNRTRARMQAGVNTSALTALN